ncbi:MAG TPA: glycosyltransferase [Chloroflexota bacterium]|nr:glycosyltransferase [Chloroflexota bacterium]
MPERRVAFLSEHASPLALLGSEDAGGQNVYVDEVSRNLVGHGYAVDVFTRQDNRTTPEIVAWAPGVRVINLPAGPAEFILKDEIWPYMPDFRDAFLRFQARSDHYDVIHGNFWMSGWVAVEIKRLTRAPVVQIFHATGKTKRRYQGGADTSPSDRIETELRVVREADRIIAQCPAERNELVEDYLAPSDRVHVIPSAVNIERFTPLPIDEAKRNLGLDPNDMVIVYIGRMLPRKDARNIVRALALLRRDDLPVRLLLVGGDTTDPDPTATPEIGALRELAGRLGVLDRVVFTGKRQPDELHRYYSAGDIAVTTPWYEPFGLTPLEAMACGRPVIGSAVGGLTYTIEDGVTGFLVPPRDPDTLAARLRELLTEPQRRDSMGRAARERVEREFTWPLVAKRTAALYDDVLAGIDSNGVSEQRVAAGTGGMRWRR